MAKILVVEDHADNRDWLVQLLTYDRHQVLAASDGAQGLEITRAESPDLVIADILMPTMDGYEFVKQLRADASIAHTPVIFWTANYSEREARKLAQDCGVSYVLLKPSEPALVLSVVTEALGLSPPVPAPATSVDFDQGTFALADR